MFPIEKFDERLIIDWFPGRWGFSFTLFYESRHLELYVEICQLSINIEIGGKA